MNETKPTTYTTRNAQTSFPACLTMVPTGLPMPDYVRDNYVRHNTAIADFQRASMGAVSGLRRTERAILSLAAGIVAWLDFNMADGPDGFGSPHVAAPLIQGFRAALNYECGRLDCGTLDSWALAMAERAGLDESDL